MDEISLLDIAKIVAKKIWLIIGVAILCGVIVFVYCTMFAVPKYSAKSMVAVSGGAIIVSDDNSGTNITSGQMSVALALTEPIVDIISTNGMYQMVAQEINMPEYSALAISRMTSISAREESIIIDIKVTCENRDHAVLIANTIASMAPKYLEEKIPSAKMTVIQKAGTSSQVSPKTTIAVILAMFIGAVVVVAILLVLNVLDQTVKGEESITANYDVPILGVVPDFEGYSKTKGGQKNNG